MGGRYDTKCEQKLASILMTVRSWGWRLASFVGDVKGNYKIVPFSVVTSLKCLPISQTRDWMAVICLTILSVTKKCLFDHWWLWTIFSLNLMMQNYWCNLLSKSKRSSKHFETFIFFPHMHWTEMFCILVQQTTLKLSCKLEAPALSLDF